MLKNTLSVTKCTTILLKCAKMYKDFHTKNYWNVQKVYPNVYSFICEICDNYQQINYNSNNSLLNSWAATDPPQRTSLSLSWAQLNLGFFLLSSSSSFLRKKHVCSSGNLFMANNMFNNRGDINSFTLRQASLDLLNFKFQFQLYK